MNRNMNRKKFLEALASANPGQYIVYCTGFLPRHKNENAVQAARAALEAYARGEVELVQKRLGDFRFEYRAVKRQNIMPIRDFVMPVPAEFLDAA